MAPPGNGKENHICTLVLCPDPLARARWVRDVYSDLLPLNCTIFLQVKDEEWGGAFVDHFEGTVPDKNIFRIVKGNKVAEDSYWFRKGHSQSRVYGDGDPGTSSTCPSWTRR